VTMGEWLIADVSLSDVHMQLWMLLVTSFVFLWFSLRLGNAVASPDGSEIDGGGAQSANGANLRTLGDDLCFPCRRTSGCIDSDWDACSVVGAGEVRFSSKTAKQRFADISPNCVSKPKSMTPSGMMSAISLRCRITSRITPQGESAPKFQ
jgi:hypothetical protein